MHVSYTYIYTCTFDHACMHITCMHVCMYTHARVYICVYMYTYMHLQIYAYVYVYTYTHTSICDPIQLPPRHVLVCLKYMKLDYTSNRCARKKQVSTPQIVLPNLQKGSICEGLFCKRANTTLSE